MHRRASQVALIYAVLAAAWIVASDTLVARLPMSIAIPLEFAKGLAFVGATALALYWVVLRISEHGDDEMHRIAGAERLLTQVLDTSPIGIFLLNDEGHITYMNHGAEELTSSKADLWVGRHFDELRSPTDGEIGLSNLVSTGYPEAIRIGPPDSMRTVVARSAPVDSLHPEAGTVLVLLDVTDAEFAEKHASSAVGAYRFVARATSVLAKASDEGQIVEELTGIAVRDCGFVAAWGLSRKSQATSPSVARVGLRERGIEVSARRARDFEDGKLEIDFERLNSAGVLVRNDLAHDPTNPWYVAAEAERLAATASFGVAGTDGSRVVVTLFADTVGFFDEEMLEALQGLRSDLAFTVERIALERKRLEVEETTGPRDEAYKLLFHSNPQPMWVYAADTLRFLAANDAAVAKYGHDKDEFLGMTIEAIRPEREVARLREHVTHRSEGFSDEGLWTHRDVRGREFPVHVYSHDIDWEGRPARLVMALEVARIE
jgi:PAS domain S-box-containing protein